MIRNLTIDGLRGFNHFELRDLGTVNLLVGTNNCGKSTVLESIQMLSSPGELSTIYRILTRRGEDWWDASERVGRSRHVDIRRLFQGHEIHAGSCFSIDADDDLGMRGIHVEVVDSTDEDRGQSNLFEDETGAGSDDSDDSDDIIVPLSLCFSWSDLPGAKLIAPMTRRGGLSFDSVRRHGGLKFGSQTSLITTSSLSPDNVIDLFEAIVLTPEEELVVEALRIIEPTIDRIATGGTERIRSSSLPVGTRSGILVRCTDNKHRIPIGSMGDGIWRMLGLALALVRAENGMLLVDEIDTGLHYSVMQNMWRLIYKTAKRLNVQVFATTHSRDCYESLAVICKDQVSENSDITIQRIERGRRVAVGYTEQEIVAAAERGMEVR